MLDNRCTTKLGQVPAPWRDPQLIAEALRRALAITLTGVGVGSSVRGLQGLVNLGRRNLRPVETVRRPSSIMLSPPRGEEEEKTAAWPTDWLKGIVRTLFGRNVHQVPGSYATAALGGAAGLAGGWKGVDWMLDRRREQEVQKELAQARREYEQALASQSKIGCALNRELDRLFELVGEKQAQELEKAAADVNWPGPVGLYGNVFLLMAALTGIPASVWAYKATKARQPGRLLGEARKRYRRVRETARPTPVLVSPAPMEGENPLKSAPGESEMEGSPLDKTARRQGPITRLAGMLDD